MIKFVLVWCRLLLPKPTIYPTLSYVSKWILSNLQPAENYLARGIWWCWKSSRAHACLQGFHFINIFSVRFAQYNRLQNSDFWVLWNLYSVSYWGISKVTLFKKNEHVITFQCRMIHLLLKVKGQVHTIYSSLSSLSNSYKYFFRITSCLIYKILLQILWSIPQVKVFLQIEEFGFEFFQNSKFLGWGLAYCNLLYSAEVQT